MVALALLVPAPSLGVLAGMILFPGTLLGQGLFALSKLWLFLLPVLWLKLVDRERLSLSPLRLGGMGLGCISGCGISLLILLAYVLFGQGLLDRSLFVAKMQAVGLDAWPVYLGCAAYWILINSVLAGLPEPCHRGPGRFWHRCVVAAGVAPGVSAGRAGRLPRCHAPGARRDAVQVAGPIEFQRLRDATVFELRTTRQVWS